MPQRDALLRLHKTLQARRAHLCEKLVEDLASLRDLKAVDATGDSADAAFEADGGEMSARLAELDNRELRQIERALARLHQGTYGICEGGSGNCQKRIPLPRLNALPYTPFCIICEREMEMHSDEVARQSMGNWAQVFDAQAPMQDQRIHLSELEMGLSGNWRG